MLLTQKIYQRLGGDRLMKARTDTTRRRLHSERL